MLALRGLVLVCLLSCACGGAAPHGSIAADLDVERDDALPVARTTHTLLWNRQPIGYAVEERRAVAGGHRYLRREQLRVLRGDAQVDTETTIRITADDAWTAQRIEWNSRSGAVERGGVAWRRTSGAWEIHVDGEEPRTAPAAAIPIELVAERRDRNRYRGPVLLAGYGFALATLSVRRDDSQARSVATLATDFGAVDIDIELDERGRWLATRSAETTSTPTATDARLPAHPPELVDATARPVSGGSSSELLLSGVSRPLPPEIPGQAVTLVANGAWRVRFAPRPRLEQSEREELRGLVRSVAAELEPALDAPAASGVAALALGRGDCSTYARLLAARARESGHDVRLVTGYRIGDGRMVRHRWAMVRVGAAWVATDPTYGEAMVPPGTHLALATHGDSYGELALADEIAFAGTAELTGRYESETVSDVSDRRCDRSTLRTPECAR